MLKSELIERNELLTQQNTRLSVIVKAQMAWIASIHDHYTATQSGLYTIVKGIDEARVDFKSFLRDIEAKLLEVPTGLEENADGVEAQVRESTD